MLAPPSRTKRADQGVLSQSLSCLNLPACHHDIAGVLCDAGILLSSNVSYVDLSRNYLSGTIPAAWLALPSKVERLNLGSNQVTGTIPGTQSVHLCCQTSELSVKFFYASSTPSSVVF
jgi:hypothetical protein